VKMMIKMRQYLPADNNIPVAWYRYGELQNFHI
jgi:hypothetical protein